MSLQIVFGVGVLTVDKCFKFSVTVVDYASGSIDFDLYSSSALLENLGSASANGDFTFNFDFNALADRIIITFNGATSASNIRSPSIKLDVDCTDTQCSECFDYRECHRGSQVILNWYNDDNGLGFEYENLPLVHTVLVRGAINRNQDFSYPGEQYHLSSNGITDLIYTYARASEEMIIEDLPPYMHQAIRLGIVHDHFFVNSIEKVKFEGVNYTPDWDTDSPPKTLRAPVLIKLANKDQNTFQDNCL